MEVFQYSRAPVALAEHGHEGLTIDPILAIHRGQDAYVTFHVIENGEMVTDYYSLNAFYRHGFYGIGLAGLPRAFRSGSGARYLNACFVDIDCYKAAIAPGTMAGYVLTLQATGIIPYVSVIVRSGQGLWAMWLLVDAPNTNLPPTAHAPRLLLWKRLQQELVKRFAGFKVDRAATDVARAARERKQAIQLEQALARYSPHEQQWLRPDGRIQIPKEIPPPKEIGPMVASLGRDFVAPSPPSEPSLTGGPIKWLPLIPIGGQ